jgi:hypothetical protein
MAGVYPINNHTTIVGGAGQMPDKTRGAEPLFRKGREFAEATPKVQSNPSQVALVVTSIARTIRTLPTVGRANRRQLQGCGTPISRAHGLAIF